MASFSLTKETLSPLLLSPSVRRGSLDMCQKLGSQLLSPRRQSSDTTSPKHSAVFLTPDRLLPTQFNKTEKYNAPSSYHYKRRASDSLWIESISKLEGFADNYVRRRSFSPQHPLLLLSKACGSPKCPNSDATSADHIACGVSGDKVSTEKNPFIHINCNVIPPSPTSNEKTGDLPNLHELLKLSDAFENSDDVTDDGSHFHYEQQTPLSILSITNLGDENNHSAPSTFRRCSSGATYDLDDNLIQLAAKHSNLALKPGELLGKGSFGTVVAGVYHGKNVAVKVLKTTNIQRKASVQGESNALELPKHSNIAQIIDIFQLGPNTTLIIMEKMQKGNLFTLLNDPDFLMNCDIVINFSKQIALALIFCHRHDLLHLDVKPQNVLVDWHNCCKLSDFGNSKKISDLRTSSTSGYKNLKLEGTVPYTAPELFRGSQPTEKCDVYSLAITMWHIHTREPPYHEENEHAVIFRVVSEGLRPSGNYCPSNSDCNPLSTRENRINTEYTHVYQTAWNSNPSERPEMTDIHKSLIKIQFIG